MSMAHRLDVRPGHKVLDVGTGSGYSAGLFARRFGDENVTSVDMDPYLVEAARTRLAEFGRTPRVAAVDATGELPEPEYDRIMATVSVRPVPASWLRALRPGGRLVTTIAHTALLITAEMGPDGVARAEDGSAPPVHQGGPRRLRDDLERVRGKWEENGRFPLHTLRAELTAEGGALLSPDGPWVFTV
ncbi:methyltransferase domain-containing protein [Streptomyces celluloflavus]|uniref:methyltransferase domain-containing protein n=1 Tax=Streptomyces celluloflavus TaxID=58344 RepID=UPI003799100F